MAEKSTFIQIVDRESGRIQRVIEQNVLDAYSTEEKLALSRSKDLYVITHRLEPIVKVELRKTVISQPMTFVKEPEPEPEPIVEISEPPIESPRKKGKK